MDRLSKTVLITGCSSGIGRSTAIHFARLDWQVIATVRHQDDADKLMMLGYTNIQAELLDIDDEEQIHQLTKKIKHQNKDTGLDVLINNAAIAEASPLEYAATEHLHKHFSTNVIAPMVIIRDCMPMLKKNKGVIVNICSSLSKWSCPLVGVYSASKAALHALSDVLRVEVQQSGVKVIVVEPGIVDTPLQEKIYRSFEPAIKNLPKQSLHHYQSITEKNTKLQRTLKKHTTKPSRVAQIITQAVTDESPKHSYTIGYDARLLNLIEPIMPLPIRDRLWKMLLSY